MRRVHLRHILAFGLALCLVGSAYGPHAQAQDRQKAIEYAYPDLPVWTLKEDENGTALSPFVDFARDLFKEAGVPFSAAAYPPKRLYSRVVSGESAFSILVNAPILEKCCLRSEKPVGHLHINVYSMKGTPRITSQDDLRGKTVVLMHGYTYGKLRAFLEQDAPATEVLNASEYRELFAPFFQHRQEALDRELYAVSYAGPSEEIMSELSQHSATSRGDIQTDVLFKVPVNLVLSKSYPGAGELMGRLERIAAGMDIQTYMDALGAR